MKVDEINDVLKKHIPLEEGKKAFNRGCWAAATEINRAFLKVEKARAEKLGVATSRGGVRLTPEERAQEMADFLDEKLVSRELTASEIRELKDIFNLKAKDQGILIEQVDFRDFLGEDAKAVVEAEIKRANEPTETTDSIS